MAEWPFDQLKIIGYYDVVNIEGTPCPVPPIYQVIGETDSAILPYDEREGRLIGRDVGRKELEILVEEREATLLPEPITPHSNYRLWVVQPGEVLYGSQEEIDRQLIKLAHDWIKEAKSLIEEHNFERAKQLLWCAVRAEPDSPIGYLLLKDLLEKEGKTNKVEILKSRIRKKFDRD